MVRPARKLVRTSQNKFYYLPSGKSWTSLFQRKVYFMDTSNRGNLGEHGMHEAASEARGRLEATIEKARAIGQQLQDKSVAAARATDQTVRDHPYSAMGIAFGLGLLVGALVMRSRRD